MTEQGYTTMNVFREDSRIGRPPNTDHLSESELHELLSAEMRRVVLDIVVGSSGPVELDVLAAKVAARESEEGVADEETRERVATLLHHTHLPKMAELGVVEYDVEATQVETCP